MYTAKQGWYVGPNLQWSFLRYPVDQAGTLFTDPYALVGFSIGFRAEKGLSVFLDVQNLTNIHYPASVEPIADARTVSAEDRQVFYPGDGINFNGGAEWRF
jgi:iron complex outermembrane receptor protein